MCIHDIQSYVSSKIINRMDLQCKAVMGMELFYPWNGREKSNYRHVSNNNVFVDNLAGPLLYITGSNAVPIIVHIEW